MVLTGERVILRSYDAGFSDGELRRMYAWTHDPEVTRWSGTEPISQPVPDFVRRFRRRRSDTDRSRRLFAVLTKEGEMIGRVGCFNMKEDEAELGIVIGEKAYWGQGYGREAIIVLVRHLFETTGLRRVYLHTFRHNGRAQRCFAACGFRSLGPVKSFSFDRGEHEDVEMEVWRSDFMLRFDPEWSESKM